MYLFQCAVCVHCRLICRMKAFYFSVALFGKMTAGLLIQHINNITLFLKHTHTISLAHALSAHTLSLSQQCQLFPFSSTTATGCCADASGHQGSEHCQADTHKRTPWCSTCTVAKMHKNTNYSNCIHIHTHTHTHTHTQLSLMQADCPHIVPVCQCQTVPACLC